MGTTMQNCLRRTLTRRRVLPRCPITFVSKIDPKCGTSPHPSASCRFRPFLTKNSKKSNRKKIIPTSWRSQTPSKTPSMHPPGQANHSKPSLDAKVRLEVFFYGVLCTNWKKIAAGGSVTTSFCWGCRNGSRSGKSARGATTWLRLHNR